MTLTLSDLKYYRPFNNRVILKPAVDTSKFRFGNAEFFAPINPADGKPYDPFKSQPVVCQVVSVPRKLIFGKHKVYYESTEELDLTPQQKAMLWQHRREAKFTEQTLVDAPIPGSMMWKTPIQVTQGDIVWVNSNYLAQAEKRLDTIEADGQLYYILPYESMYLKKTGDDVTMLNGFMLLEVIEDTPEWKQRAEKAGLTVPNIGGDKYKDRFAIVRYIGDPVEYLFNDRYDYPEIEAGDIVMLQYKINRRLEPGAKYFAKDGADLIVSRRCNVMAVMEN